MQAKAELARNAGLVNLMTRTVTMLTQGMAITPGAAKGMAGQVMATPTGAAGGMVDQGMATTPGAAGGLAGPIQGLVPGFLPWLAGGQGVSARLATEYSRLVTGQTAPTSMAGQRLSACGEVVGMAAGSVSAQGVVGQNKYVSTANEVDVCREWRSKEGCIRDNSCRWLHPENKGRMAGRKERDTLTLRQR